MVDHESLRFGVDPPKIPIVPISAVPYLCWAFAVILLPCGCRSGQVRRGRQFERATGFVNDISLLAEEVDPVIGELLGNFQQAFSHIGLVNAAWAISESEGRTSKRT